MRGNPQCESDHIGPVSPSLFSSHRHPGRRRLPHQVDFFRRQAVGFIDQVADLLFEFQRFAGEEAQRVRGAGGFFARRFRGRNRRRVFPAAGFLDFGEGVVAYPRWQSYFNL